MKTHIALGFGIAAMVLLAPQSTEAITLPTTGYMVYNLQSDGGIYRRMLNEDHPVKIVNKGRSPNINPRNGGIIVYIEDINKSMPCGADRSGWSVAPCNRRPGECAWRNE